MAVNHLSSLSGTRGLGALSPGDHLAVQVNMATCPSLPAEFWCPGQAVGRPMETQVAPLQEEAKTLALDEGPSPISGFP